MRISTSEGVVLRVLGLKVANAGYRIEAPGVTKAEVIRGFRIVRRDETHLKFEEPGSYAVAPLDLSSDDEDEDDASRLPLILGAAAVAVLAVLLFRRRISYTYIRLGAETRPVSMNRKMYRWSYASEVCAGLWTGKRDSLGDLRRRGAVVGRDLLDER